MAQTLAHKRPLLARAVVAALATLLAFIATAVAYNVAVMTEHLGLARGLIYMLPLTSAWIATALTQHLVDRNR